MADQIEILDVLKALPQSDEGYALAYDQANNRVVRDSITPKQYAQTAANLVVTARTDLTKTISDGDKVNADSLTQYKNERANFDAAIYREVAAGDLREENRAKTAEANITTNLTTEVTNRLDAVKAARDFTSLEVTRAQGIEAGLRTDLNSEVNRATGVEAGLRTDLTTETNRAKGIEAGLRTDLTSETNRASGIEAGLRTDLTSETNRAKGVEAALRTDLTAEVSRSTNRDEQHDKDISTLGVETKTRFSSLISTLSAKSRLRDGLRYPWAIVDSTGRIGALLTRSATFMSANLSFFVETRSRDGRRYYDTWRDKAGKVFIGIRSKDGIPEVSDLSMLPRSRKVRDTFRYATAIKNQAGLVMIGFLRSSGTPEVPSLSMLPKARRLRDTSRYFTAIKNQAGLVMIGFLRSSGTPEVSDLSMLPNAVRRRDARPLTGTLLRGFAGRALMGWTPEGIDLFLSSSGARHVNQALLAPPSALRGQHSLAGPVMQTPRYTFASVQEGDNRVSYVQQLRQGTSTHAVAVSSLPLRGILVLGQSNAGSGSAEQPFPSAQIKTVLFPYHVFHLGYGEFYGDGPSTAETIEIGLFPGIDDQYGQSPRNALLWSLEQRNRDAGIPSPGYIGATNWRGGFPLDYFLPGAVVSGRPNGLIYNNCISQINGMIAEGNRLGRGVEIDVYFLQGENSSSNYLANLNILFNALSLYIQGRSANGRPPLFMVAQTNNGDSTGSTNGNDLDQWTIARTRGDTILATPMHCFKFHNETDAIHIANIGRLEQGEVAAIAYQTRLTTGYWKPLSPRFSSATRSGATLTVPVDLPAGEMKWDTDRMPLPTYGYRGIQVVKASDGSNLSVSNVVLGSGVITITLSADPSGPVIIKAGLGQDGITDLWAGGRVPIYSEEPTLSIYFRLGLPVWQKPRHYMIKFSITTN